MSKVLSTAKRILISQVTELYDLRRDSCESVVDYQDHYKDLGSLIFQIDKYDSFGDLLNDLEDDNLTSLGYYGADEDLLESFISIVIKSL
jgi:hypothetical protein